MKETHPIIGCVSFIAYLDNTYVVPYFISPKQKENPFPSSLKDEFSRTRPRPAAH